MATWKDSPNWTPFDDINGGQQFSRTLRPEDLNALAENIAYLYENQGENEYLGDYVGGNYRAGAIVKYSDGNIYMCIKDTDDEQEPTNTTYWKMLNTASSGGTVAEWDGTGIVIAPIEPEEPEQPMTFTINGISYTMENRMTWYAWTRSEYNIDGFSCASENDYVYEAESSNKVTDADGNDVLGTTYIVEGGAYLIKQATSLITFTLNGTTYACPDGITWGEYANLDTTEYPASSNADVRWLDSASDGTGMQFNNNGVWQFILYNGEIVENTDTIIGRAVYTLESPSISDLVGVWRHNPDISAFGFNIDKLLITSSSVQTDLIIGAIQIIDYPLREISLSYSAVSLNGTRILGLELESTSYGDETSKLKYGSGGTGYSSHYSTIDYIEFNENILDSSLIIDPYIFEFMNTYFVKQ